MKEKVTLLDMFPDYVPPMTLQEALSQAAIVAADIAPHTRSVSIAVHSEIYLPCRLLEVVQREICDIYGLDKMEITATYPEDQLTKIEPEEVRHLFIARDSMSQGSLAGARWEWEGQTLHIHLKANGKDALQEVVPAVTQQLQDQTEAYRQQAALLEQNNQKLSLYISQLGTVQGVKHIANEKLGLVDPNDFFFKPVDHTIPE